MNLTIQPHLSYLSQLLDSPVTTKTLLFSLENERLKLRRDIDYKCSSIVEELTREKTLRQEEKSKLMTANMSLESEKSHTTKADEYGTVSLVCVSSCHWMAGPQRAQSPQTA